MQHILPDARKYIESIGDNTIITHEKQKSKSENINREAPLEWYNAYLKRLILNEFNEW